MSPAPASDGGDGGGGVAEAEAQTAPSDEQGPVPDSFFNSPVLSDIDIHCGDNVVKAHKVILAQSSQYFKRLFVETPIKEEHRSELRLYDDSPLAVAGMIAWAYNLKWDWPGKCYVSRSKPLVLPMAEKEAATYAFYLVDLYAAANKYEFNSLKSDIMTYFDRIVQLGSRIPDDLDWLEAMARSIYVEDAELVRALRTSTVELFVSGFDRFNSQSSFQQLLLNIPELTVEILRAYACKTKEAMSEQAKRGEKRPAESQAGQNTAPPALRPSPAATLAQQQRANALANAPPLGFSPFGSTAGYLGGQFGSPSPGTPRGGGKAQRGGRGGRGGRGSSSDT